MNVWIEGARVKVTTESSEIGQQQLQNVEGAAYNSNSNCWTFPLEQYDSIMSLRNRLRGNVSLKPIHINSNALTEIANYLERRAYSQRSIQTYHRHLAKFLKYTGGRNDEDSISRYMAYLKEEKKASPSYSNNARKAIELHLKIERLKLEEH